MTDSGNHFTKFSIFEGKEIVQLHRVETKKISSVTLNEMFAKGIVPEFAFISSVNKQEGRITKLLEKKGIKVTGRKKIKRLPVEIKYKNPSKLGFDRIAAACGAYSLFPGRNILVIDAGTALTIDIISEKGVFLGGTISPGLKMRFNALYRNTDNLPLVKPDINKNITGISTKECINSGALHGMLFELEGFIRYYERNYRNLKIIMTGGDTEILQMRFKNTIFAELNLVHIGLNEIFDFHFSHL
jgi:type III pantothenate kinase